MEESEDTLIERIRQIVGKTLNVEPNTLHLTDPIYGHEDGSPNDPYYSILSGFYWVEVNTAVEEEFHLEISNEDMARLHTIADYASYVRRQQAGLPPFEERPASPFTKRRTAQKKLSAPQDQPLQEESASLAWKFHQGHWERTDDLLQQEEMERTHDRTHALQQRGYKPLPILCMGKQGQGMRVEVYVKEHKEGPEAQNYYTRLWIGSEVESIYVSNLPSLITLLHRFGPIIANSQGMK